MEPEQEDQNEDDEGQGINHLHNPILDGEGVDDPEGGGDHQDADESRIDYTGAFCPPHFR